MTLISIRARGIASPDPVVSIDGQEYPFTLKDPFSPEEEQRLEWYFERYLNFPFTDQVKAQTAGGSVRTYGEQLFATVFADRDAYAAYRDATQGNLSDLTVEIAGSPAFQRLHWEALKDPKLSQPLALQANFVRRNLTPQPIKARLRESPTVNVLLVTARPGGARDVGYRTIARPLLATLRQAKLRVKVDILRPGTYEALSRQLEQVQEQHGAGYYHVIHFDVHGGLLTYAAFDTLEQKRADELVGQHTYQLPRYGRPALPPYQGVKAFLFCEHPKAATPDPVEAAELANLLQVHGIPIAILNACQSAKQLGAEQETSLGSQLMAAGVQMVLAMGYSVTVSAARLLMGEFYDQLFRGASLGAALRSARLQLYNDKRRRAYYNQQIDLEDWLLPVVYENRPQALRPREFTAEESAAYYAAVETRYPEPQTTYRFVGRDLDILELERRLLNRRTILLLRGMGGAGKTTLLRHLGWWWQRTGFVDAGLLLRLRPARLDAAADHGRPRPQAPRRDRLPASLPAVGPGSAAGAARRKAVCHAPPADPRQPGVDHRRRAGHPAHAAARRAAVPPPLCPVARRRPDPRPARLAWRRRVAPAAHLRRQHLRPARFGPRGRLRAGRPHPRSPPGRGLPQRSRPRQADQAPGRLSARARGGAGQPPAARRPRRSSRRWRRGSRRSTPQEQQDREPARLHRLLLRQPRRGQPSSCCSAWRRSPAWSIVNALEQYTEQLKAQPALAHLPFARWGEVLAEAVNWGLLAPHSEANGFLRLQPILPYFLRNRLQAQPEFRTAVETAFRELYDGLGGELHQLITSKDPQQRQLGLAFVSLEFENLTTALELALQQRVGFFNPYEALYRYLHAQSRHAQALQLSEQVLAARSSYTEAELNDDVARHFYLAFERAATSALMTKQYAKAERAYQEALGYIRDLKGITEETRASYTATIYHQLGRVAEEQRQWAQAEQHYQQALAIYIEFNDRYSQASTYHQLGIVAQEQRQWAQAEQHYQQALAIFIEFDDRYSQARTYHQLGSVAQEQRQWAQAEQHYQQALAIYIEFDDRYSQASTYHQLGIVAQEQRQWAQAEQHYQQALAIFIEFDDRYSQASTYHQLGSGGAGAAAVGAGGAALPAGAGHLHRVRRPLRARPAPTINWGLWRRSSGSGRRRSSTTSRRWPSTSSSTTATARPAPMVSLETSRRRSGSGRRPGSTSSRPSPSSGVQRRTLYCHHPAQPGAPLAATAATSPSLPPPHTTSALRPKTWPHTSSSSWPQTTSHPDGRNRSPTSRRTPPCPPDS